MFRAALTNQELALVVTWLRCSERWQKFEATMEDKIICEYPERCDTSSYSYRNGNKKDLACKKVSEEVGQLIYSQVASGVNVVKKSRMSQLCVNWSGAGTAGPFWRSTMRRLCLWLWRFCPCSSIWVLIWPLRCCWRSCNLWAGTTISLSAQQDNHYGFRSHLALILQVGF